MAELVQLTRAQLVQLQLGVRAQDHVHVGGGRNRQLVQLIHAQIVQLQLYVQAHLDPVGGGMRLHPALPSRRWEYQPFQM